MTEHLQATAKAGTAVCAAIEETAPPPRPMAMPTQVIEFWTPRLMLLALLYWLGRALRRGARGPAFSPADSHEPR